MRHWFQETKILLPPVHIELGSIKQFVTDLEFNGEAFQHIRLMYPQISKAISKGWNLYWASDALEELEAKMNYMYVENAA